LYCIASEQGNTHAQYTLAQLLRAGGAGVGAGAGTGTGLPRDPEWAAALLAEAAVHGHGLAALALAVMYLGNEVEVVGGDTPARALELLQAAAGHGVAAAHTLLGNMYFKGQGIPADAHAAVEAFRRGAQAGDPHAHMALAKCYTEGTGVAPSDEEAFTHHMAAAEKGVCAALRNATQHNGRVLIHPIPLPGGQCPGLATGLFNVGYHYFMGRVCGMRGKGHAIRCHLLFYAGRHRT
jgi:TPR repeat protein